MDWTMCKQGPRVERTGGRRRNLFNNRELRRSKSYAGWHYNKNMSHFSTQLKPCKNNKNNGINCCSFLNNRKCYNLVKNSCIRWVKQPTLTGTTILRPLPLAASRNRSVIIDPLWQTLLWKRSESYTFLYCTNDRRNGTLWYSELTIKTGTKVIYILYFSFSLGVSSSPNIMKTFNC